MRRTRLTLLCLSIGLANIIYGVHFAHCSENAVEVELDFESRLPDGWSIQDRRGDSEESRDDLELHLTTGAQPEFYPTRDRAGQALKLTTAGQYLRIDDSAEGRFDFGGQDKITLEAWVNPKPIASGRHAYVVSKGRTYETGVHENHNYALRLTGGSGSARPSFLFSTLDADNKPQYHRWTAKTGFTVDGLWHHIAISYSFGDSDSLRCIIDSEAHTGKWDMGGKTELPPIESDEPVWIGSSRGGDPNNSFVGKLDDIRIHRRIVPASELRARWQFNTPLPRLPNNAIASPNEVVFAWTEDAGAHSRFPLVPPEPHEHLIGSHLLLHALPTAYEQPGVRRLRNGPVLLQAFCERVFESGEYEFLIRSGGLARLWVDEEVVATLGAKRLRPNAHNPMVIYEPDVDWLRPPQVGDREQRVKLKLDSGPHNFVLETLVGSNDTRCEPGEVTVAWRAGDGQFQVLAPESQPELWLTDADVSQYRADLELQLQRASDQRLAEAASATDEYWRKRHTQAADYMARDSSGRKSTAVLLEQIAIAGEVSSEAPPHVWLRRMSLDTRGVPPSALELEQFLALPAESRREIMVDRFLADERWADHWTSYWQDVLAENPNILKPSLGNTGPFRLWIHDSLRQNKAMDRFVTELLLMGGDSQAGGPAGFGLSAENDVPMAEKGHIVASAFLGVDMKCARCHDAPYHPWKQESLFQLAAMLDRKPIKVPSSSSVPREFFEARDDAPIEVTLFPGDVVSPQFPSAILGDDDFEETLEIPRLTKDNLRETLAIQLTRPGNRRFAKVITNRVWMRLHGWGLVGSADDWLDADHRYGDLLDSLADDFVRDGYDVKRLTRRMLLSPIYAARSIDSGEVDRDLRYRAVWQRRMTAEQLVDSLHATADVPLATESLTFDGEASQQVKNFLNLGPAKRAWQLTSLSNERDRPSLSLPKATAVAECMEAFGWQGSRQSPHTERPTEANMIQPGIIANGHLTGWVTRMTPGSLLHRAACQAASPEEFTRDLYLGILGRQPTPVELATFAKQLQPEFESRLLAPANSPGLPPVHRGFITWSNHFDVRANKLRRDEQLQLAAGPTPAEDIAPRWRERAEDAMWALVNSPEFQLIR